MKSPLRSITDLARGAARPPSSRGTVPVPIPSRHASTRSVFSGTATEDTAAIDAMGSVGTLFNIVSTTSQSVAKVEWQLWRTAPSGDPADRKLVTQHLALQVWDKPNDFMSGMRFREAQAQHLKLTGEACWVLQRQAPAPWPVGIWPVRPDRITPVPSVEHFLSGYVYTSPDGEQVPLGVDDVIRPMQPHPGDPYRGMGFVQSILTDLDSERYTAEWNRNFFRNSAEPGGILEIPDSLDDQDFRRIQARWNEQHRGVTAAHRVAILESGMKWVDRSFSQRDMQFAELRAVGQDVIRQAAGFPAFAAGKVDDVNRATAEASDRWFDKHLTVPDLDRMKDALNTEFLPLFGTTGQGVEFDYVSPLQEDEDYAAQVLVHRSAALKNFTDAGVYGPDALELAGLPADASFGQPDADPDTILLTTLVTGAPSLAPQILPVLMPDRDWSSFAPRTPAPAPVVVPAAQPPALEPAPVDRGVPLITSAEPGAEKEPDGNDDSDADTTHLDGCMIALMPRAEDAARLAVPGGERPEDLHLTLRYLGPDAGMWPPQARDALTDCVASWFWDLSTAAARLFGAALWNADGDKPVWVYNAGDDMDVAGLSIETARAIACAAAEDVAGAFLPDDHSPWNAHVAAAYSSDPVLLPELVQRCGPMVFDRVRVSFGDDDRDIPLRPPAAPGVDVEELVRRAFHRARAVIENAQRWVVEAHLDDNTCEPCRNNDGALYRNRESAYADYPDGRSYVHCVGEEFGNHCRCRVVKRGRKSQGGDGQ